MLQQPELLSFWNKKTIGVEANVIYIMFCSPLPRRLRMKFGFDWPSGFRGEDV